MTPLPVPDAVGPAAAPQRAAGDAQAQDDIRQAAEALEGVFLSMLMEEMFKDTGSFDANPMYGGLATEKLGDELARSGGIGLSDLLTRQLGGGT